MQKIVEQNEGIPDPRFSDIQSSLPPKIIPDRMAKEQEFNIGALLAEPSSRTGNAAMPTNPDTLLKEVGEEAPKEYINILLQQDGEQVPTQALPQEDAIQQRLDESSNQQTNQQAIQQITNQFNEVGGVQDKPPDSASQFVRSQMQQGQARNRKQQWYTNEGQTVLRQAQRIQLPS
ncbi:MAG: hypothetical protein EZS28_012680 [Streblomastix strix]|uniref:Uncharacterized protein n=1 Tax=Streblomastix strix TaxID=222440 RepID=A0A5J4WA19_9EUKA|nr:MAG: hypothetical protein EZS28_012680 [Streblomastix strix]